jgi:hypothetical protein
MAGYRMKKMWPEGYSVEQKLTPSSMGKCTRGVLPECCNAVLNQRKARKCSRKFTRESVDIMPHPEP